MRASGSAFLRNYQSTGRLQKLTGTCKLMVCTIDCLLLSVCSLPLAQLFSVGYVHQLSFLLKLNYVASHLLAVRERESSSIHARNCVYLNSKNKNSFYHQELVSHPMPEYVVELSSLVRIKF